MNYRFISRQSTEFPVTVLCRVMGVSRSCFYAWRKRPAKIISADELQLYRRAKALFESSRNSLGSKTLSKKLCEEGFQVGRYRTRPIMPTLELKVQQRVAYKVTTKRKHSDRVADNLLNQNFNPLSEDEVWAGDITYLRTHKGWMYLAIVMDLYSRRIVGWPIDKRMTSDLIGRALMMAINLRQPRAALVFHSDRGYQYTGKLYQSPLASFGIRPSMGDVGACWDNAVVERFFGSLKHDWMKLDVAHYIRYYNNDRSHIANGNLSPVKCELSQLKVCGIG